MAETRPWELATVKKLFQGKNDCSKKLMKQSDVAERRLNGNVLKSPLENYDLDNLPGNCYDG
jgi:hypothetical protein